MKNKEMYRMWELFIRENKMHPDVDPVVQKSWIRSKNLHVNPFLTKGKIVLKGEMLYQRQQEKSTLINISSPLMESLHSLVKNSGFIVVLCDESGFLLKVIGDKKPMEKAEKINFLEGADWSEEAVGTNAIGTAIKENMPLQIYSCQHFTLATQTWTCSAAPIHDADGKIIGVLNMSGPSDKVHSHTFGMVVATVKAIEYELQLLNKTEKNEWMKSYLEEMTNTLGDGILLLDKNGVIIKTNRGLHKLLNMKPGQLEGKYYAEVFGNQTVQEIYHLKKEILNQEIKLSLPSVHSPVHVLLSAKPILKNNMVIGHLLTAKEIKKVHQLVNRVSGNQAKVSFAEIIGKSPCFISCLGEAKLAAKSNSTVLLTGESGTGKDLFAQAIHHASSRRDHPFIAINCGAIPRSLLGSELFGYEEGSFTGARKGGNPGKFELADGGTIFLDEIGEMSLEMQVLLLRVLQNREITRIGGNKMKSVDVRIIAATNKDLKKEVEKGNFREDLFFRLNVLPIHLPALRMRKDDIPLLAGHFLQEIAERTNIPVEPLDDEVLEALQNYDWPGNIRELQNILERILLKCQGGKITLDLVPGEILGDDRAKKPEKELPRKEKIKKQALIESINIHQGNLSKAAKYLGISRSTLYRQVKRYGIE